MIILEEEEIALQVEEAFLESDVPYYEGEYTVTPTGEAQTLPTGGMRLEEDIVVEPVPGGELATPSIDVSSSGLITAQAGVSESGYIADTDTKSATQQLSTQAGKTVTPTESEQTAVDEHKYTTGKVKVAAVPSDYVGSGIARKDSSSLSASGKRVTAPAGYYAEAAGKDVAGGSATTPATEITANPSISVDANGLITAGVSKTQSITPTVVEGYVENGTAGNVSVSGSATSQLPTDNGSEVTPSTQEQTLNLSGKFMKGNVKVKKIPSEYVVPSGTKEITKSANGTTTENVSGYAEAEITVNVPASAVDTGTKTITANGNGQNVVGYAAVNVNVPNTYAASDEGKVVQSGALVSQSSATYTENGTYDTTLKNEVVVDVQSGGGATVIASGNFTGDGTINASMPIGKKMACADFVLLVYCDPTDNEFVYQSGYNIVIIGAACFKEIGRYDLSTDGTKQAITNQISYVIDNNGTKTTRKQNGVIGAESTFRQDNNTNVSVMRDNMKIVRASTGFTLTYFHTNTYTFVSGKKFYYKVVYFGSDAANDIVEVS